MHSSALHPSFLREVRGVTPKRRECEFPLRHAWSLIGIGVGKSFKQSASCRSGHGIVKRCLRTAGHCESHGYSQLYLSTKDDSKQLLLQIEQVHASQPSCSQRSKHFTLVTARSCAMTIIPHPARHGENTEQTMSGQRALEKGLAQRCS